MRRVHEATFLAQCSDLGRFMPAGRSLTQYFISAAEWRGAQQCLASEGPGLPCSTVRGRLGRLLEKAQKAGKHLPLILTSKSCPLIPSAGF